MTRVFLGILLTSLSLGSAVVGFSGCASSQNAASASTMLREGAASPALQAQDHLGKQVTIPATPARAQLVFFYPRDNTPGCTTEACALRDAWDKYEKAGVEIIGVSSDSLEKHREFATEHRLPFSLVADVDHVWGKAFGVESTMGMYARVSFLIGKDGKIAAVFPKVDPALHADEVLAAAAKL